MSGLDIEDAESADTIVALFKHLITVLGKTDLSNKLADDIVWILLMEVCLHAFNAFLATKAGSVLSVKRIGESLGELIAFFPGLESLGLKHRHLFSRPGKFGVKT